MDEREQDKSIRPTIGGAIRPMADFAQPERERELQGIGWAIKRMYSGHRVFRRGWNGKGQSLGMQQPDTYSANTLPYVFIVTVENKRVPWVCSQTDLLAIDWEVAL